MRGPARAAGLGDLQRFLEKGFDTFKAMHGAKEFIALVGERERVLGLSIFTAAETSTAHTVKTADGVYTLTAFFSTVESGRGRYRYFNHTKVVRLQPGL